MNEENYGARDWELPCICGHSKKMHEFKPYERIKGRNGEDSYCRKCQGLVPRNRKKVVHKFVLDNLALIEQVAKAKGLV